MKKYGTRLLILCLCLGVSGCNNDNGSINDEKTAEENILEQFGKGKEVDIDGTVKLDRSKLYKLNEVVECQDPLPNNPNNIGLEATVTDSKIFSNPEEAGIDRTRLLETSDYDDLIHKKPKDPLPLRDIDQCRFLVCDVNLKNIGQLDPNITTFSLVYLMDGDAVQFVTDIAYFSYSDERDTSQDKYYSFDLLLGQSMDVRLGWVIDRKYDLDKLYLCDNYDSDLTAYIKLDL